MRQNCRVRPTRWFCLSVHTGTSRVYQWAEWSIPLQCCSYFLPPSQRVASGEGRTSESCSQLLFLMFLAIWSSHLFPISFWGGTLLRFSGLVSDIRLLFQQTLWRLWRVANPRMHTRLWWHLTAWYTSQDLPLSCFRPRSMWPCHRRPRGTSRWRKLRISWISDLLSQIRLQSTFLFWLFYENISDSDLNNLTGASELKPNLIC